MNLQSLVDRARSLSGIRLQSIRSDEQVEQVVNEAYQEVLDIYPWPFLRGEDTATLPAGQATISLADDFSENFRYLTSVVFDTGSRRIRLQQTTMDELDTLPDDEGEPQRYARVDDNTIRIWPTTNREGTVEVRGQLEFAALSGPYASPQFSEQFHPLIAYRAAARMLSEEGDDSGRGQAYQMDAAGYLARMEKFYMGTGDAGIIRIGSQRRGR